MKTDAERLLLRLTTELKGKRRELDRVRDEVCRTADLVALTEQRAVLTFDGAPVGYLVLGGSGTIVRRANAAALTILDRSADTVLGRHVCEVLGCSGRPRTDHRPSRRCRDCALHRVVEAARQGHPPVERHEVILEARGRRRHRRSLLVTAAPFLDEDCSDRVLLCIERPESASTRPPDRIECLSWLASGIATDVAACFATVLDAVVRARRRVPGTADVQEQLEAVYLASRRGVDLSDQLLTVARSRVPERRSVTAARLVRRAVAASLGGGLSCRYAEAPGLWPFLGDVEQLGRALRNVLVNAAQSMEGGGTVEIDASNVVVAEGRIRGLAPGPYVRLAVTDQGPGIPDDLRDKVLSPFFTTREGAHGLGLTAALVVARRHGGSLTLDTPRRGRGLTTALYLPAQVDEGRAEPTAPEAEAPGGRLMDFSPGFLAGERVGGHDAPTPGP